MIILHIRKFFDCCVEFILCAIIMLIYKIIFQCIEISFHRGIIIWISGLAHALLDTKLLTKFRFICNIPRFLLRLYLIRSVCYNYSLAPHSALSRDIFTHDVSFRCWQGQGHHNIYAELNSTCAVTQAPISLAFHKHKFFFQTILGTSISNFWLLNKRFSSPW